MKKIMKDTLKTLKDKRMILIEYTDGDAIIANKVYSCHSYAARDIPSYCNSIVTRVHIITLEGKVVHTYFNIN